MPDVIDVFEQEYREERLTEEGYRLAGQAQQVFGGHGYIEETGMSQFVRDARIAMIYEGATGVQALDLVGRKLPQKMGKPIMTFFETRCM